jgi:hypothetical protein
MSAKTRSASPAAVAEKKVTTESTTPNDKTEQPVVKKSIDWASVGNVTNVLILCLTAAYAIAVVGHGAGWWVLTAFGKNWAADGFCISFKGTLAHTHLLCFYGDSVFTLLLLWLTRGPNLRPELVLIRKGAGSIFFHGLAHATIWANEQWGYIPKPDAVFLDASSPLPLTVVSLLVLACFWASFLCLLTPLPGKVQIAQTIAHSVITAFFVPSLLLFCYVNTVLFVNITGAQLYYGRDGERDIFYALGSLVTSLPIMVATWAEPIFCDAGLVNLGGHILFDYSIPSSSIAFIAITSKLAPRKAGKTA